VGISSFRVVSPDKTLHAQVRVHPVDFSPYANPDMESRVMIRTSDGNAARQAGLLRLHREWSPDAGFFVYSLTSAAGHQPWSFPIMIYSRSRKAFAKLNDMIGGEPTLSGDFELLRTARAHRQDLEETGGERGSGPVTVDPETAFANLKLLEQ
jgi:hypothetical protein